MKLLKPCLHDTDMFFYVDDTENKETQFRLYRHGSTRLASIDDFLRLANI
jgi:hypothetical protein